MHEDLDGDYHVVQGRGHAELTQIVTKEKKNYFGNLQ